MWTERKSWTVQCEPSVRSKFRLVPCARSFSRNLENGHYTCKRRGRRVDTSTRAVVKVTSATSNTYEDLTNVLSQRIGNLRNGDGDGDGNEKGKSNIFRLVKEQLYMCITFFCHYTCLYRYRTIPYFTFYWAWIQPVGIQVLRGVSGAVGRRRSCLSCTIPWLKLPPLSPHPNGTEGGPKATRVPKKYLS